jgi:hypothetical protein
MVAENKLIDIDKSFIENQTVVLNFMLNNGKTIFNKGGL